LPRLPLNSNIKELIMNHKYSSLSIFDRLLQFIFNSLLPERCACCQVRLYADHRLALCNDCHFALPWLNHSCSICALPLDSNAQFCGKCLLKQPAFASSKIAFRYDYPLNHLILDFKFNHRFARGKVLSQLFIDFLQDAYKDQPFPDALIPVPMYQWRRFQRGFNQSELLVRDIARTLGIKTHYDICQRNQHIQSQKDSGKQARRDNLKNAFGINANKQSHIAGKHLALVDDVVTTGSTVDQLSKLLLQHGAASVVVWALARTPEPS
jgi:ComF family protein